MNVSEIIEALRATPETGADPDVIFAAADALESAQKDAARYRWLRSYNTSKHERVTEAFFLGDENLDHAIDTAMAAQEQSK